MGKFIDLSGQQFGEMLVLEKDVETSQQKKRVYWKCQCSCGRIKSIRGDSLKNIKTCGECKKDLTNQRFGRLVALEKGKKDKASHQYWICKCDCGNIVEVNSDNLRRGLTQSCGCLHSEITHQLNFKDITGQKFGKLTPMEYFVENSKTYWRCRCECGNECIVSRNNLINLHTQSCGCINYSIGENNIAQILKENNIEFKTEYIFSDLPQRRFDFYLPQHNRLIEFDGVQHTKFNNTWYQTKEEFLNAIKRDIEKNQYALEHQIELIRIPHTMRDKLTLELLLSNQYLIKEVENNGDN